MTAPAKELTRNAKLPQPVTGGIPTQPAAALHVFVTALARLGYDVGTLLAASGVGAAQLDDPDGRVPCTSIPAVICEAMRMRPLKNLGMKVAYETPIGAFQLLDYLIVTCANVREAAKQLARYLRISEAPFAIEIRDDEDPIRVLCGRWQFSQRPRDPARVMLISTGAQFLLSVVLPKDRSKQRGAAERERPQQRHGIDR